MKNIRSGTTFFLIYINGQREAIESDVYNKKKIQMFVVNMTFISSREVKKCIHFIRALGTHEIYIFSLHSMK